MVEREGLIEELARDEGFYEVIVKFDADRRAQASVDAVQGASREAQQAAVQSTPSFLIRGSRGTQLLVGVPEQAAITAAIEAVR